MHNLIITLISIQLFALVGLFGVSYIKPERKIENDIALRMERGFNDSQDAFGLYRTANLDAQPSSLADIFPAYGFLPPAPKGMSWSFGSGGTNGRWICLSGSVGPVVVRASQKMQDNFSVQAMFIHQTCGQTTNLALNPDLMEGGSTQNIAITYWLSSYVAP